MKFMIIGVGDCGCRIAGSFAELNRKAKTDRKIQIINGSYAVNNNRDELLNLAKGEFKELQTIFVNHQFSNDNLLATAGADMMRIEGGRVLSAIKPNDFL